MAQCRHLPGLHPQFRRRQRRRRRRHRRHPLPAALSEVPRRGRHLDQPLVQVADGRPRLRRRRLPGHRPALRHPGRGRAAHRGGARARDPRDSRHRAQSHLRPARLVPGRPRRRPRQSRARAVRLPPRPRTRRFAAPERLGLLFRRPGLDPAARRAVVPAPVRTPAARPELATPGGAGRVRVGPAVLVQPGRGRLPHRRRPRPDQTPGAARPAAAPGPGRRTAPAARRPPALGPGRGARDLPELAQGGRRVPRRPRLRRRGLGGHTRTTGGVRPPGRTAHRLQLRLPHVELGPEGPARRHRRLPRHAGRRGRTGHLGPVQPRRHAPPQPLRPPDHQALGGQRDLPPGGPPRPGTRHPPCPGRRPADARPARRRLRLPGRGTGPARGRGPARVRPPGPDLGAFRPHRPGP